MTALVFLGCLEKIRQKHKVLFKFRVVVTRHAHQGLIFFSKSLMFTGWVQ